MLWCVIKLVNIGCGFLCNLCIAYVCFMVLTLFRQFNCIIVLNCGYISFILNMKLNWMKCDTHVHCRPTQSWGQCLGLRFPLCIGWLTLVFQFPPTFQNTSHSVNWQPLIGCRCECKWLFVISTWSYDEIMACQGCNLQDSWDMAPSETNE